MWGFPHYNGFLFIPAFFIAMLLFNTEVEMMTLEKWPSADKPTVGTLVAVRFSEDGLIYRAKVGRE